MSDVIKFLIVEDELSSVDLLYGRVKDKIKSVLPSSEILMVDTWERAMRIITQYPPPTVALVDLGLPDMNVDTAMALLPTADKHCAVVVVSGLITDDVRKKLSALGIDAIEKVDMVENTSLVMQTIYGAVERRANRWWKDVLTEREITKGHLSRLSQLIKHDVPPKS